ncbi:MAG: aldehyde dehydrogenase family protein [Oligoflexia bacterium]|nr:aldehyde dehydrogenase family protein [Oligoflexia bacterium]
MKKLITNIIMMSTFLVFISFNFSSLCLPTLHANERIFPELLEKYHEYFDNNAAQLSESQLRDFQQTLTFLDGIAAIARNSNNEDFSILDQLRTDLVNNQQCSADLNNTQLIRVITISMAFHLLRNLNSSLDNISDIRSNSDSVICPIPTYQKIVSDFDLLRGLKTSQKTATKSGKNQQKKMLTTTATTVALPPQPIQRVASNPFLQELESPYFPPISPLQQKIKLSDIEDTSFFSELATAIEKHQNEFIRILTKLDNYHGAVYEINQTINTLRGVRLHEWSYLNAINGIRNIAVYGSRNIPLYTIIMHAIIPGSVTKNLWFRTPQGSRQIYVELFAKIVELASTELTNNYDLSNIHMLTENTDVQYDNFLKKYVLGLNHHGNAFATAPAEAVIFIGNPNTAATIQEQIRSHLNKLKHQLGAFKQIFLKFGSGLNPVIITQYATKQINNAVNGIIDAVRINNFQDCIAPKFFAIHKSIYENFVSKLLDALQKFHAEEEAHSVSDYAKLNFAEDLEPLVKFKERYLKYLLNTDASIDVGQKLVTPHIFSFPANMFQEVELMDRYAPFIILFKYEDNNQLSLKEIATDPRVRDRAMYASIYGDGTPLQMWEMRKKFEDNLHSTILNLSVYDEESGNFPFGGHSSNASSVTVTTKRNRPRAASAPAIAASSIVTPRTSQSPLPPSDRSSSPAIQSVSSDRPLLFSKEAARYFSGESDRSNSPYHVARYSSPSPDRQKTLREIIIDATNTNTTQQKKWKHIKDMQVRLRLHGIQVLRDSIAQNGLTMVVNCDHYQMTHEELEHMYGTKVICWNEYSHQKRIERIEGVALHSTETSGEVGGLNRFRGEINPHLGYGTLSRLLTDRVIEYKVVEAIWPQIMPSAITYSELLQNGTIDLSIENERLRMAQKLDDLLKNRATWRAFCTTNIHQFKKDLKTLITDIFTSVQLYYPTGAFVKNYGESTGGAITDELMTKITTFSYDIDSIVNQYSNRLINVLKHVQKDTVARQGNSKITLGISDPKFQKLINAVSHENGSKFINRLLFVEVDNNEQKINQTPNFLFQEHTQIAQSELGFDREVRVDYIDGEPVNARGIFSHEYSREDEEEAIRVIQIFFSKAPAEFNLLSGGANVAKLEDGRWAILELNAGTSSGSTIPLFFPIEANHFISNLQGHNTPLIEKLESAFHSPIENQRQFILSFTTEEEKWYKKSLADISQAEIAKWLRDRYIDEWRKHPTKNNADQTLTNINTLFQGLGGKFNSDFPLLRKGAANYLNQKMLDL